MHQFSREMGCTPADIVRWTPQALGELYPHTSLIIDGQSKLNPTDPLLQIVGFTMPSRKIALLEIPILSLKLAFAESFTIKQCEAALGRFDLYTRRGGG